MFVFLYHTFGWSTVTENGQSIEDYREFLQSFKLITTLGRFLNNRHVICVSCWKCIWRKQSNPLATSEIIPNEDRLPRTQQLSFQQMVLNLRR